MTELTTEQKLTKCMTELDRRDAALAQQFGLPADTPTTYSALIRKLLGRAWRGYSKSGSESIRHDSWLTIHTIHDALCKGKGCGIIPAS